jgi:hypothetical protein
MNIYIYICIYIYIYLVELKDPLGDVVEEVPDVCVSCVYLKLLVYAALSY